MPFVKREQLSAPGIDLAADTKPITESTPAGQVFAEAFSIDNSIGAALARDMPKLDAPRDPMFDPFAHVPAGLEAMSDRYVQTNTVGEVGAVTKQIIKEMGLKQRNSDAGALGVVASMTAGIFDPIALIPVGGVAYRTYRTGGSVLRGAVATASAAAVSMSAQEAAIHHNQITRTFGESAVNVTAAMFLSGILGGGAAAITRQMDRPLNDILQQVEDDLTPTPTPAGRDRTEGDDGVSTVGSQQAGLTGADLDIQRNKAVDAVAKAVGFQDPTLRLATSSFDTAKGAGVRLAETPLTLRRNELGIETPISVERSIKVKWEAPLYNALRFQDDAYSKYVKNRSKRFGDTVMIAAERIAGKHADKLSHREFRQAIGHAMRNGDVHEIPEVQAAAKNYRSKIFDPMLKDAIDLKLLDEGVDVKTAQSYLNRIYSREALVSKSDRFVSITTDWLARKQRLSAQRVEAFEADIAKLKSAKKVDSAAVAAREVRHQRDIADLERSVAELESVAHDILRRIVGSPGGRLPYGLRIEASGTAPRAGTAAPLKARVFDIEDELIEEFLENDVEAAAKQYVRTMAPDIELTREFGDVELRGVREELQDESSRKQATAKTPAERQKIERDFKAADRDLVAISERLRGVYKLPDDPLAFGPRVSSAIRELNYIAKLGGMTLSAIPDVARPVMVHGFGRVFKDVVIPAMSDLKSLRAVSRQVREDMGGATDMLLNTRARAIAGLEDGEFLRLTKFERGVGAMSDTFGMVSLMAPWNTAMKQIAGTVSIQRIVRAINAESAGTLSKAEAIYLRSTGISVDMGQVIARQLKTHGAKSGKLTLPNITEWGTDQLGRDAADTLSAAVTRDIDRIIVTPGQDKPLGATGAWGEFGRHLFQFRSFGIASTQRTMLAGLQQADAAALNGMWLAVALGMAATAVKSVDAGRDISGRDAEWWIKEGVDRSGVTGWVFDANNMLEKATRGHLGVSPMLGQEPLSRYASRNAIGAIFGPTLGSVEDVVKATGGAAAAALGDEPLRQSDVHAMRRLIPYNNLMGFRQVVDEAEINIGKALGAKQ